MTGYSRKFEYHSIYRSLQSYLFCHHGALMSRSLAPGSTGAYRIRNPLLGLHLRASGRFMSHDKGHERSATATKRGPGITKMVETERRMSSSSGEVGDFQFDTYKFVQKLEAEGFSRQQSEAIMQSLSEVINERLDL
jgi:hypothetical protein